MNTLYYGDNLEIMRKISDETIDLIYLDPPFNSKKVYNVIFKDKIGTDAPAQIEAFTDSWSWSPDVQDTYDELMLGNYSADLKNIMEAFDKFMHKSNLMAYLTMMAIRFVEFHRILKPTGSIYLHCDTTANHYLKILMDQVFGVKNFKNEIVWKRTFAHNDPIRFGRNADRLLFYTKTENYTFNVVFTEYNTEYIKKFYIHEDKVGKYQKVLLTGPGINPNDPVWKNYHPSQAKRHWSVPKRIVSKLVGEEKIKTLSTTEKLDLLHDNGYIVFSKNGIPRFKQYLHEMIGVPAQEIWTDIPPISSQAKERLGYPTQKPITLLERIVNASSNPDDIIFDPFCGCGTAIIAAETLRRKWIGIDITHLAVALMKKRLKDNFNLKAYEDYDVIGEPRSVSAAKELAEHSKSQFEFWAVSLVGGQPYKSKGGGDTGIDGFLYFKDYEGKLHKIIIEIKGGGYQPKDIRALHAVMQREKAPLSLLIALKQPTKGMLEDTVAFGKWQIPGSKHKYPVMQIFTIEEYFDKRLPDLPDTK